VSRPSPQPSPEGRGGLDRPSPQRSAAAGTPDARRQTPDAAPAPGPRPPAPLPIGVLVSGRGSNLEAIRGEIEAGTLPARIALVATNKPGCRAAELARGWGLPMEEFPREAYPTRRARDEAIAQALLSRGVQLVVLAGYDRILHPQFVARFHHRILNTHNSLLPAFGGSLHAVEEALAYGVKLSGCTVHFVTEDVDGGPIVVQRAVPVLEDDGVESLSARIRAEEHRALPEAIRLFAEGRLRVLGRRVHTLRQTTAGPL
jgi:phosphoribosylglycinamide formyltransferase-1